MWVSVFGVGLWSHKEDWTFKSVIELSVWIKHKSLILAQIERWRHALHMQVERQHGVLAP